MRRPSLLKTNLRPRIRLSSTNNRGSHIARYLCILLDRTTVLSARNIEALDDEDAIKRSLDLPAVPRDCVGFALWQMGRKIHHYTRPGCEN